MVSRPSGKMTTGVPVSTRRQISFIAIGLASGMSIAEVVNLYRDNGTTIFGGAKPDPEVEPTSRIGKIWTAIRNRVTGSASKRSWKISGRFTVMAW